MISKDAQKIIDRLAAHAWDRQNIDREAVEIAISRHLAELGLPVRPFQWLTNANEGYAAARDAAWDAARDAAWAAAGAAWAAAWAAWSAARAAARAAAGKFQADELERRMVALFAESSAKGADDGR